MMEARPDQQPDRGHVRHRRLRAAKTKGCVSRQTALAMVIKLARSAERHWRTLDGLECLGQLIQGVRFRDGKPVLAAEDQAAAWVRTPNLRITPLPVARRLSGAAVRKCPQVPRSGPSTSRSATAPVANA
jgi:hypothetical protein